MLQKKRVANQLNFMFRNALLHGAIYCLPPANVLLVIVSLFIPSSGLPVSPMINLTAVTYTLYSVYGVRLSRVYVPVKLVLLGTCFDWL